MVLVVGSLSATLIRFLDRSWIESSLALTFSFHLLICARNDATPRSSSSSSSSLSAPSSARSCLAVASAALALFKAAVSRRLACNSSRSRAAWDSACDARLEVASTVCMRSRRSASTSLVALPISASWCKPTTTRNDTTVLVSACLGAALLAGQALCLAIPRGALQPA